MYQLIPSYREVLHELFEVGYEAQPSEVIKAIGLVVPRMMNEGIPHELNATVVMVEMELFATERYYEFLNETTTFDGSH